jgi:hypothetical protein
VEILLDASPGSEILAGHRVEETERGTIRLRATLAFPNGSRLDVRLIVNISSGDPVWMHYSFHYMDADLATIFRYDNAKHYRGFPYFPHHKHEGPDEEVVACKQPSVRRIRDEIEAYLKTKG